ncbi:MAG: peptidyl-prolyl cis-trans isomerase [Opitutaceae bacterium]
MISWIQVTFEKHTKVFLAFLLIVITVPFVFTIGAAPGIGRGERTIHQRDFFGHNLVNPGAQQRLISDARIAATLRPEAMWTSGVRSIERFAFLRTAALSLADRYRIPQPTAAERSKFLASLRIFQDEQGRFDSVRYNQFRDEIRQSQAQVSEADVARVLSEEIRIRRIDELLAGPGYIAPAEVAGELALTTTEWTLDVAAFDLASYNPVVKPAEDVLAKYFEENAAAFEIPERANVDYVTFAAADFAANDPLNDDDVVAFFEANKQRFAPPAEEGKPAVEPTLATVRPQVEASMRANVAAHRAAAAASDFAYELYEKKLPKDSAAIDALIAKYRGRRATAPLFTRTAPPAGLPWNRQIVDAAFQLDDSRYFSDALTLGSDHLVLLWRETFPKTTPNLAEVRADVLAAYTANEKNLALQRNGAAWKSALEAKLKSGVKLADAVATLGTAPKSEVKSYGPFARRQPAAGLPNPVLGALEGLSAGAVSDLLVDEKNAYLVHVVAKKLPAIDSQSAEYTATSTAIASNVASATRALVLNTLVDAELARTEPTPAR